MVWIGLSTGIATSTAPTLLRVAAPLEHRFQSDDRSCSDRAGEERTDVGWCSCSLSWSSSPRTSPMSASESSSSLLTLRNLAVVLRFGLVFVGIVKEKIFFLADLCSFRSLRATRLELESDRTLVPLAGASSPGVGDGKVTAASSVVSIFDCDRHRSRCWEDLRFI